jgi:hypothetical protein
MVEKEQKGQDKWQKYFLGQVVCGGRVEQESVW